MRYLGNLGGIYCSFSEASQALKLLSYWIVEIEGKSGMAIYFYGILVIEILCF